MKLYYAPAACSMFPHIIAREAGIELGLEKVDLGKKQTESGRDYLQINPKGYVPALELDDGQVLTEAGVIGQYLADQRPDSNLAPANGTLARYRLQETLNFITSEIHKTYSPLFNKATSPELREDRIQYLRRRYALIESWLNERPFLQGEHFSVADAYLFVTTHWSNFVNVDLSDFPAVTGFQQRVAARPAVQSAMRAEGLM